MRGAFTSQFKFKVWLVPLVLTGCGLVLAWAGLGNGARAMTIGSDRDCDANAVIHCGARSFLEVRNRSQNAGVMQIFGAFGISSQDIKDNFDNSAPDAVEGVVTNNNNVWIHRSSGLCPSNAPTSQLERDNPNLCLVATDAMTAGRQNMPGSTRDSNDGVTFYRRPPSVSFQSAALPAFVVMNNGKFDFAIIASCGNPVTATPVTPAKQQKPQPAPQPTKPAAVPPAVPPQNITIINNNTNVQSQQQQQQQQQASSPQVKAAVATTSSSQTSQQNHNNQQSQTQSQSQPRAVPEQRQVPTTVSVSKSIPNTGPGEALALAGMVTAAGSAGHFLYSRRKTR